jgi:hypothetical protein
MTHITVSWIAVSTFGILCACGGVAAGGASEGQVEKELVGALDVVDELLPPGPGVAELGDKPAGLAMALRRGAEGVDLDPRLVLADLLHARSHVVVQIDEGTLLAAPFRLGAGPARRSGIEVRQGAEADHSLPEERVHPRQIDLVRVLQEPVQVLGLQDDLAHIFLITVP